MGHEHGRSSKEPEGATTGEPMIVRAARRGRDMGVATAAKRRGRRVPVAALIAVPALLVGLLVGAGTAVLVGGGEERAATPAASELVRVVAGLEERLATLDDRLATGFERSDAIVRRLERIETRVGEARDAPPTLTTIEERTEAVEDRILAMLARSDLAMRQLTGLDALRANEIARLGAATLPGWRGGDGDDAEARILAMMADSGALEATLDALKDAPVTATATDAAMAAPQTAAATPADATILRMVGGDEGLVGALDTLDRLRRRMADALSSGDPAAAELRRLGGAERSLRALLLYVEEVATELASGEGRAAAAVPLPDTPELGELEGDDPLLVEVRRLAAATGDLHAALNDREG